jgi:hypothetical protein
MTKNLGKMAIKRTKICIPFQGPPNFTQFGIFDWKTFHLGTLFTVEIVTGDGHP